MGKIVALGGGRFDNGEMDNVARKIISLSKVKKPTVLFIPAACRDEYTEDDETVVCFKKYGARADVLYLIKEEATIDTIKNKIEKADIIYVFGGNLRLLMNTFRSTGADEALTEAYKKGKVLSGVSSGAMCWFKRGYDDCGENGAFEFIDCLNIIPYINCPHYQSENWQTFKDAVKGESFSGIAEDNGAALCLVDGEYSVFSGNEGGNCYFYDKEENFKMTVINENPQILKKLKCN